jgi:hypothetical protein
VMRWRIRRIVNGCAAHQLVARRDVIAPEFISDGLVIHAINRKVYLKQGQPLFVNYTLNMLPIRTEIFSQRPLTPHTRIHKFYSNNLV